jgi:hypothetical protein
VDDPWFRFVLAALATWRVAHLLAHEDGPWDIVARLRAALGESAAGRLLDCFYCLSFWVAAPIALAVVADPVGRLLAWLALSGAACVLERYAPPPAALIRPVVEEAERDELLRTEARDAGEGVRHGNRARAGADDETLRLGR